jgi:pyridoxal phosphate enzyme (YggS family)
VVNFQENLGRIRKRINAAALRASRDPGEIKLVAVTKKITIEVIKEALALGITSLGENRVQELLIKYPQLGPDIEWHFVGHLQTNKVKKIIGKVSLIHSLDSWPLAVAVSRTACEAGIVSRALMQVNVAGEETKYGLSPEEAEDFAIEAAGLPGLELCGLMAIAPECEDPEEVRYVFRQTRELAKELKDNIHGINMDLLSMGMTGDYEVAVEEGSNILRLGTALFGRYY